MRCHFFRGRSQVVTPSNGIIGCRIYGGIDGHVKMTSRQRYVRLEKRSGIYVSAGILSDVCRGSQHFLDHPVDVRIRREVIHDAGA